MDADLKRVLFISYAYPPTGGAGVQRSVKFTKYLPSHGWRPTVLTVSNPSVPVMDADLVHDVDDRNPIVRAKTREPSYRVKKNLVTDRVRFSLKGLLRKTAMAILQPDPQVLWNRNAYLAACRTLTQTSMSAIYVTGPPFSSFLLAQKLKRKFSLPLVVDFRDEWLLASRYLENHQRTGFAFHRQLKLFKSVLRDSDAVIATTQASANELRRWADELECSTSTTCIYNGFDEDDFFESDDHDEFRQKDPTRYRIVYTGTLWRMTDVSPLVEAFSRVGESSEDLFRRIEIIFAGRRTDQQQMLVDRLRDLRISVHCYDYLPHHQSIALAQSADALLLLLADEAGAERVVPAKLFEYLALDKPILAVIPDGESSDLLKASRGRWSFILNVHKQCWIGWKVRSCKSEAVQFDVKRRIQFERVI